MHRRILAAVCFAVATTSLAGVTSIDDADVREQLFKLQKDTARLLEGMAKLSAEVTQQQASPACAEAASRTQNLESQVSALKEAINASQSKLDEALAELRAMRLSSGVSGAARGGMPATPAAGVSAPSPDSIPGSAAPSNPSPPTRVPEPGVSPTDSFHAAYADYSRRMFDLALDGFRRTLAADPKGPLADDAQYWIGETLLSQGKPAEAIGAFDLVVTNWPNGEKRLAAEVRKGVALVESGRRDEGVALLQKALEGHPGTPEAQSAREFLRRKGLSR